jgi:hypothetical protein
VSQLTARFACERLRFHDVRSAICVVRFLVAIPFGYAFSAFLDVHFGIPIAFLLGTFPSGVLMKAGQRLAVQRLGLGEDSTSPQLNELESLQCVSRSNAERFMSEGINTIAQPFTRFVSQLASSRFPSTPESRTVGCDPERPHNTNPLRVPGNLPHSVVPQSGSEHAQVSD